MECFTSTCGLKICGDLPKAIQTDVAQYGFCPLCLKATSPSATGLLKERRVFVLAWEGGDGEGTEIHPLLCLVLCSTRHCLVSKRAHPQRVSSSAGGTHSRPQCPSPCILTNSSWHYLAYLHTSTIG